MTGDPKAIVLIHGLWMTPRSWEFFRSFYEKRGFEVHAPAWPRMQGEVEDVRRDPSALAGLGIAEIAAHYEKFVRTLREPPILMGHFFGGLIVQMLLDRGFGAAGVAIDSAAPKGVFRLPLPALRAAAAVLWNPLNYWGTVRLSFEQFRYAFANAMGPADAKAAYERYAVPGPGRPVFQAASANLNPWAATKIDFLYNRRAPLLFIAGARDHTVPPSVNLANHRKYARSSANTQFKEFALRSHLIIAQEGWQEVAEYALAWARPHTAHPVNRSDRASALDGGKLAAVGRAAKQQASAAPAPRPTAGRRAAAAETATPTGRPPPA